MSNVKIFKGRPALKGDATGPATVTKLGFNATATYMDVVFSGSKSGVCKDHDNNLYDVDLADTILCIPQSIGSSAAACTYMAVVEAGIAPKAMLFANPIDSVAACGLIMAYYWSEKRPIIAIDNLGAEFLETVENGDQVEVSSDGTVTITTH
jgi:predicted aconitase with swiveling domain